MTTAPIPSITDEQIAEIEVLALKTHESTADLFAYGNAINPSKFLALISRLRAAERDAAKLRDAMGMISREVDGNIRPAVRDIINGMPDVNDIYNYCDEIDRIISETKP